MNRSATAGIDSRPRSFSKRYGSTSGSPSACVTWPALEDNTLASARRSSGRRPREFVGNALLMLGERESGTGGSGGGRGPIARRWRNRHASGFRVEWAQTQNNLGSALETLGERESGTAQLEEAVAAYRVALEELTRERAPLQWAATEMDARQCARNARHPRERNSAARGGGRRRSRSAGGIDARAGSAPMGGERRWRSAMRSQSLGYPREREQRGRGGGRGLSRGARGIDARASSARLGEERR